MKTPPPIAACPMCGSPGALDRHRVFCDGEHQCCMPDAGAETWNAIAAAFAKARAWDRIAETMSGFLSGDASRMTVNFDEVLRDEQRKAGFK